MDSNECSHYINTPSKRNTVCPPANHVKTLLLRLTPEKQCYRAFATNKYGEEVSLSSPSACHWCVLGWLLKNDIMVVESSDREKIVMLNDKGVPMQEIVDKYFDNFKFAWF